MLSAQAVPAFSDNYLWVLSSAKTQGKGSAQSDKGMVVVDPGDASPVLQALKTNRGTLEAILITHHHADHIGGLETLLKHFPDAQVYAPDDSRIHSVNQIVREGDTVFLNCLGCEFSVIEVPGHTRSHIAYYGDGKLFCGDTVFACGCGRLFEGTPEQMHASLTKILALPDDTEIYCAHEYTLDNIAFAKWVEPDNRDLIAREHSEQEKRHRDVPTVPSTLRLEKQTNPFLRFDEESVIRAAEQFAGRQLNNAADVFGTIRYWKDTKFD